VKYSFRHCVSLTNANIRLTCNYCTLNALTQYLLRTIKRNSVAMLSYFTPKLCFESRPEAAKTHRLHPAGSGSAGNFYLGVMAHGAWRREEKSPSGRWSRCGNLEDETPPQMLKHVADMFTDFDCRNDKNLKILHNSRPDSWPRWG